MPLKEGEQKQAFFSKTGVFETYHLDGLFLGFPNQKHNKGDEKMFYIIRHMSDKNKLRTKVYRQEYKPMYSIIKHDQKPERVKNFPKDFKKMYKENDLIFPAYINLENKYLDIDLFGYWEFTGKQIESMITANCFKKYDRDGGSKVSAHALLLDFLWRVLKKTPIEAAKVASEIDWFFADHYIRRLDRKMKEWILPFPYMEFLISQKNEILRKQKKRKTEYEKKVKAAPFGQITPVPPPIHILEP